MNQIFSDVTNINAPTFLKSKSEVWPFAYDMDSKVTRHNPYAVKILPDNLPSTDDIFSEVLLEAFKGEGVQKVVVQFKCHTGEYTSKIPVEVGAYVVVQGDRGIDIGVVLSTKYVPSNGSPNGSVIGCASQKEVDYWATDLKKAEHEALQISRQQVLNLKLDMSLLQAEYQYDKKKLTLYYAAPDRVEYEVLTKELFRQFGCRIWLFSNFL
eukprot:gene6614-4734_t